QAKINKTESDREDAVSKLAAAKKERTDAESSVARQENQTITAPRTGYILRIHAASSADLISRGEPFIEFAPDVEELAVEFFMRGIDAPLVNPGRSVRLQFEGWPAVQFAGWPSVAVGTFGGKVAAVDAQVGADGRFRVLVTPDKDDQPWPDERFLRQGVRTSGWCQLETVRLGYEVWRQLNAFPPTLNTNPLESDSKDKKGSAKKMKSDSGGKKGKK
ncbi:MAG: hypothetical protein AAF368_17490, partial [Planctomycetota bacterium]